MDLQYSPEQEALRDSVHRFVRDEYDFATRRRLVATEPGFDTTCWQQLADFGWLAVPFDEADGGLGGDATDVGIVMEGIGRGLMLEPYLANVVLAGGLLAALGDAAQRAAWLQPMTTGALKLALAWSEPGSRYELTQVATTASQTRDGWRLDGRKSLVLGGGSADAVIVVARTGGGPSDADGLGAFIVPTTAPGLAARRYAMHDGQRAADFELAGVVVPAGGLLGPVGGAAPALEKVFDAAIAAVAAEAVGAMSVLVDTTLEYLKTRKQFGRTIGTNQALQHRMVDMHIALDEARSMALYGALMLAEPDPRARGKALSMTKIEIDRTARLVGQEAVQLHGAMGVTEELAVGHYFKRLSMIGVSLGDASWHLRRHAALA